MTIQQDAPKATAERVPARARRGPNRTWRLLQKLHRWASLVTGIVMSVPFQMRETVQETP